MTEVRNPEIVALSPLQSNKLEEDKLSPIQANKGNLLGTLHLNNSEGIRHHTNLSLSDKEQIQEVNDDELLSQINDICGDDQELNEPKSAASYGKESLESISEESLPNSNSESLLCEESNERSVSAFNTQDENQPSPIETQTSPVENESSTEIHRSPMETETSPEMEPSPLEIQPLPKENDISPKKIQPPSMEIQLSPLGNESSSEEIQKFPSDVHTEDEELSLLVDDEEELIVKEDSTKNEGEQVSEDAITEIQETHHLEADSRAKGAGVEVNEKKSLDEREEDSQLKQGELVLEDGNSNKSKTELEVKNDEISFEKKSELSSEDSQSKEENIQMDNTSTKVEGADIKAALSPVHFESKIHESENAITKDESTNQEHEERNLFNSKENHDNKELSKERELKEEEDSGKSVTHSNVNPLEEEDSSGGKKLLTESNEVKDVQSSEENKRKREISPVSGKDLAPQNSKESGTKRLKTSEEIIEDSDDEILFYTVPEETTNSEQTSKPVPEDSDDEPIIFYKVPRPAPTPVDDDDDDDVEIIEDASSEMKKDEVEDIKNQEDVKDLDKVESKEESEEKLEIKEKVEEKIVTAENTNEKRSSEEGAPRISEVEESEEKVVKSEEKVEESEKIKTKSKNEDSDDDIVIVEDYNNPLVTPAEAVAENVKKEVDEKLEAKPEEMLASETEKTAEIKNEEDQQNTSQDCRSGDESKSIKEIEPTTSESDKETTVSTKKENLEVDNSDNACDVSETKDNNTNDLDEVGSNCSNSSNLLKSGTKSAMDQEREDYGKAKRMRMSIDQDDLTSNMSSDTDVSQSYSSHSLKRSHSKSPSLKGNDDSQSKKTKFSDRVDDKLTVDKDIMKKISKKLKRLSIKDLEHLVLQKIVESINYESKLSSLNEELEKSHEKIEKITQIYTNLKKQYNDQQLVHNRVISDLEKRNTSYVMPIKITRAVGLQVSIGAKGATSEARNTYVSNTSSTTVVKPPAPSPAQSSTPTSTQTPVQTPSPTVRRGCIQKITPKRPVPVKTNSTPPAMSPLTPQQPPKLLNRSAPSTPILPKTLIKTTVNTPPTQPSLTIANLERNIQKLTASNPIVRQTATSVMKKTAGGGPQTPKGLNTSSSIVKQLTPSVSIESVNNELKPKGVIDLTDEDDAPQPPPPPQNTYNGIVTRQQSRPPPASKQHSQNTSYALKIAPKQLGEKLYQQLRFKHPAALPRVPEQKSLPHWKPIPPKPIIRINNSRAGIVISWAMEQSIDRFATITNYQIYAYQAPADVAPSTEYWRYVDVVEAMLLPMAVTLTEFQEGLKYFFSVRAVDEYKRVGPFSLPRTWDSAKNN